MSDGATIDVGDTTITITNKLTEPFCTVSTGACPDTFTGFAFTFSSGVNITGVSVDPASAADFLPAGVSPLVLLTPTDILVNLVGRNPAVENQLILDVTTAVAVPAPELSSPAALAGLLGFASVAAVRRRRRG